MRLLIFLLTAAICAPLFAQDRPQVRAEEDQEGRDRWFYEQRRYPLGHIPTGARVNAIESLRKLPRRIPARPSSAATPENTAAGNWTLIGPRPTFTGSSVLSAGRIVDLKVDPRDGNTVYIGAAEGGVWKTNDGGNNWTPLTDNQPSLSTGALALDPKNPDIIYVGTGEDNFAVDSYYGAGILKSTDGGNSWTSILGPFLRAKIGALAIHPTNTQILLAGTGTNLWRSTDGAATWVSVMAAGAVSSIMFDPTNGNIAYAGVGSTGTNTAAGVYKSTDGGITWKQLTGAGTSALPTKNVGRVTVTLAPSTPSTLYVAISDLATATSGKLLGLYKSTDAGATWNTLSVPAGTPCNTQCWYDLALTVHPTDPNQVYFGGVNLYRTLDGGNTWRALPSTDLNGIALHSDQHAIVFTADTTKLYIGNDGGAFSTNTFQNTSPAWTPLNQTLAITQFYPGLAVSQSNPALVVGGTQDNGVQTYTGSTRWERVFGGDGAHAAIDATLPSTYFFTITTGDAYYSVDGNTLPAEYGLDFTDRKQFVTPFTNDPSNPRTLYYGTYRLYRSLDGGGRWKPISGDLTATSAATIRFIAVAPSDSNTVYVVTDGSQGFTSSTTPDSGNRVQVTTNALSASPSFTNRTIGLPSRTITSVAVDPIDPRTAYLTFSGFAIGADTQGHVFRTTDGGAAWSDISSNLPNLPVNHLAVDPDLPGTLYAATDAGVMVTSDGGASWSVLGSGLPLVVVHSVVLQRDARLLRASTHGRSVWELALPLGAPSQQPIITSISPNTVNAGAGAVTLTVTGSGFGPGTTLQWNGVPRPTVFIDSTHLSVQVPASDTAMVGRAALSVFNPAANGGVSTPVNLQVGPAPTSTSAAFVSAANPTGGNSLAPRSIASLFGVNFASGVSVADVAPPLPVMLNGFSLMLAGNPLPLFFVAPGQVNFQVPFVSISRATQYDLTVTQGGLTTTVPVTLTPFAPALFTTNSQGTGQASALIAGTATIVAPTGAFSGSRPAKAGEYVSFYATGLGDVSNRPALGSPSPSSPLAATLSPATVTIGGVAATVSFAGLAPGYVGLYQVNAQVPAGLTPGSAVPVVLTVGGVQSNTATIAVQ